MWTTPERVGWNLFVLVLAMVMARATAMAITAMTMARATAMTIGMVQRLSWRVGSSVSLPTSGNLQATAYAADLPFGNGPYKSRGVAGAAGPKTWIFDVLGPGWPPRSPGGPKLYVFSRSASF